MSLSWQEHVVFYHNGDKWLAEEVYAAFGPGVPRFMENGPEEPGEWNLSGLLEDYRNALIGRRRAHPVIRVRGQRDWGGAAFHVIGLGDRCFIMVETGSCLEKSVSVLSDSPEKAHRHMTDLTARYWKRLRVARSGPLFSVIGVGPGGLETSSVEVVKPFQRRLEDLFLHYPEDFPEFHQNIISRMKQRSTGVVLFEGAPGTGKTTYIRCLMHLLRRTHQFYSIPIHEFDHMTSSAATRFWITECKMNRGKRLVLVLEDGEHLISGDGRDRSSQIATLLNLSDGLLGEHLGLQIILTVNCPIDQIDPALRRRGRLMIHHRFDPLPAERAQALAKHHGFSLPANESQSWTLGDIFYHQDAPPRRLRRIRTVGFASSEDDIPF